MLSKSDKKGLAIGLVSLVATILMVACSPCNKDCKARHEQERIERHTPESYYRIGKLFEHDGCTVYEYYNKGHWEEFFKCDSKGNTNAGL